MGILTCDVFASLDMMFPPDSPETLNVPEFPAPAATPLNSLGLSLQCQSV